MNAAALLMMLPPDARASVNALVAGAQAASELPLPLLPEPIAELCMRLEAAHGLPPGVLEAAESVAPCEVDHAALQANDRDEAARYARQLLHRATDMGDGFKDGGLAEAFRRAAEREAERAARMLANWLLRQVAGLHKVFS